MTKKRPHDVTDPAVTTTTTAHKNKRLRRLSSSSSPPVDDSQTLQHYFENDSNCQQEDSFEADLKKAIALSLADQNDLPSVANTNDSDNDQKCFVCKETLGDISEEAFNRHVNECLDRGGGSSSSDTHNAKATASWANLFRTIPDAFATLMQTAVAKPKRQKGKQASSSGGSSSSFIQDKKNRGRQRRCPFYKWMQDTPYTVDAFCYGKIDDCKGYFLSHFHSDHYTNLGKAWAHGPVYCSQITANLVRHQLCVSPEYIRPLPMDTEVAIEKNGRVTVTLIDANHCPGAVLFLFKVQLPDGRVARHLHTGDFRANPRMCLHPHLKQPENGPIDTLYLDTTYLHGGYSFPRQSLVLQAACDMAERIVAGREMENQPPTPLKTWLKTATPVPPLPLLPTQEDRAKADHEGGINSNKLPVTATLLDTSSIIARQQQRGKVLVIVGTYLIGKEKMFYQIAKRLGTKVYMNDRKRNIIKCLEDEELVSMLTTDPLEAQVHALPMMHLKIENLKKYLQNLKPHFTSVIAFRPTGWTFRGANSRTNTDDRSLAEITATAADDKEGAGSFELKPMAGSTRTIRVFGIPYSEHSSFRELASFIASLQIGRIIPTVNMSQEETRTRMDTILTRWQQEKKMPINVVSFTSEDSW